MTRDTLIGCALLALAGAVLAEPPKDMDKVLREGMAEYVKVLDKDGDGRLSRDEYLAPAHDSFRRMDLDGDGFIVADDLVRAMVAQMRPALPAVARPEAPGSAHTKNAR